jgi:hypothetical protein
MHGSASKNLLALLLFCLFFFAFWQDDFHPSRKKMEIVLFFFVKIEKNPKKLQKKRFFWGFALAFM